MPTTTTTYSFNKPVVGADEDDWGGYLNGNWDSVDDLLDGTTPVTGIDINSGTLDGVTIGGTTAGAGTFTTLTANTSITGTLATAAQPNVTSLGTLTSLTVSGDVSFGDNDKAIFGAGSDLQIYHDGSNSYVKDSGSGDLYLQGTANVRITNTSGQKMFLGQDGGEAQLYYSGVEKLATTSTGVDITGTLTSDGLTVDGASTFNLSSGQSVNIFRSPDYATLKIGEDASNNFELHESGSDFYIRETDTSVTKQRIKLSAGGDISFYEDTGTTAKFFWDASAEKLGIGTSSPAAMLDLRHNSASTHLRLTENTSGNWSAFGVDTSDNLRIYVNTSEAMRIDSSGNVGIGTSSPSYTIHTKSSSGGVGLIESTSSNSDLYFKDSGTTYNYSNGIGSVGNALRFRSGDGTERMRIDSSGNVGIGTSSPAAPLEVSTSSADYRIQLTHTSGQNKIKSLDGDQSTFRNLSFDAAQHIFETSGTERMRIDSSGNVGIGETSPVMQLHVSGGIAVSSDNTLTQVSRLYEANGLQIDSGDAANNTRPIVFRTGGTERMRIDSSGKLLVGKTSAGYSTDGFETHPNGETYVSRSGTPMAINRNSSDGTLLNFYKDGSGVGSIGNTGSRMYLGSGDVGAAFQSDVDKRFYPVDPSNGGAGKDAYIDLGRNNVRWKDLYLSGGVYLGGTGSANKLDDYEEGTWTPQITTSGSSVSYLNQSGSYIKIGQMCVAKFQLNLSGVTSQGSGSFQIGGLPFSATTTATPENNGRHSIQTYNVNLDGSAYQMLAYNNGGSNIRVLYSYDNGTWSVASTGNFILSSNSIITASITYFTT